MMSQGRSSHGDKHLRLSYSMAPSARSVTVVPKGRHKRLNVVEITMDVLRFVALGLCLRARIHSFTLSRIADAHDLHVPLR